jgi:hypothetical protein
MDLFTLAMPKPKVIDLTKFKGVYNETEATINDVLIQEVFTSLSSGGTLEMASVTGIEGFFEGITQNRSVTVRAVFSERTYVQNQPAVYYENYVPAMLGSSYAMFFNGLFVNINVCFVSGGNNQVLLFVSAKPIT